MSVSADGYIADENDFLGGPDGNRLHEWFAPGGDSPRSPGRPGGDGLDRRRRRGRDRPAHGGADGPLGWRADRRRAVFVSEPPRARAGRQVELASDLHRRHHERHGAGEGRRPATSTSMSRAATPRSRRSPRVCWTSSSWHRSRCSSAAAGGSFDVLPREVELDVVRVIDTPAATHLRYRVKGGSPGTRTG